MRTLVIVTAFSLQLFGCTAYLKAQNRSKSARREAADIALGGAAQLAVGALIAVGSYYWYQHAADKMDPNAANDDRITGQHGAVAGLLLGSGLVLGGVADSTIGLYQGMSDDYLFGAAPGTNPVLRGCASNGAP